MTDNGQAAAPQRASRAGWPEQVVDASDEALLAAIARGDHRAALAGVARAHGAAIGRLCMAFCGSQAEAEELAQETLIAAYEAFGQFRGESSVKAFVFGVARRTCARANERRARREGRLRLIEGGADAAGRDAREVAILRQRAQRLRDALEQLRPTEREALLLRYEADLSFREVADACGCDEPAARKRASRGLARLRELLGDEL